MCVSAFNVSVLSSGSEGNALYVESEKTHLLIDAGLSGKKIEERLQSIERQAKDLDAIFVTHEHSDHIKGIGVLARRYHLPIYANALTWEELLKKKALGTIPEELQCTMPKNTVTTVGDLDVESFGVSHDARDAQFYQVHYEGKSFVDLTDTGYCSERLKDRLKNANMYLIESNHDVNMLRMGSYPWELKQRILGDFGHLSNEDGAMAMADMFGTQTKHIFLGHRSGENNLKELAYGVMTDTLEQRDIQVGHDVFVHDTGVTTATPLTEVI